MCLTQSHSYVFPFIKTRGGCAFLEVHFQKAAGKSLRKEIILGFVKKKKKSVYIYIYQR